LWNKNKITTINIHDRKNDAPEVEYKIKGEVANVRLIHSGEDFALIAYSDPNFSSMESGFIVHRSPKHESENIIEKIHIGGNIISVAPDESGYFYISNNKIFKRSWSGNILMNVDLGIEIEPILKTQLTSVLNRQHFQPILFFDNNNKMSFLATPVGQPWYDRYLFIWDMRSNKIEKNSRQDLGDYNNLLVEDDKLYIKNIDSIISKKLIAK
jgi:hypothetical protein